MIILIISATGQRACALACVDPRENTPPGAEALLLRGRGLAAKRSGESGDGRLELVGFGGDGFGCFSVMVGDRGVLLRHRLHGAAARIDLLKMTQHLFGG